MSTKEYSTETKIGGKSWIFSCGKFAPQANGSVVIRAGDTVVMATVVMSDKVRDGIDYLPLLVDYEEKLYAAGKIKGSRWIKREGRPSDEAILSGRVTDRSFRPLFDERIRNDIQVVVTVLSADQENDPDIMGLNAASAAIEISDIPWAGPVGAVRVGRLNGGFALNPSFVETENQSQLDLIVASTAKHIIMLEAGASELSEEDVIAAVQYGQEEIGQILQAISHLREKVGKPKKQARLFEASSEIREKVAAFEAELEATLYESKTREERDRTTSALKEKVNLELAGKDETLKPQVNYAFEKLIKKTVQQKILKDNRRVDGRGLDEIRPIRCEVGLLPRVHGSGLFQRGDTQVLTTTTLGGPGDVQLLEDLETEEERKKRYIHHYNMPGFASGEVAPMRSPGRREIGHGALAERALLRMIPPKETFPYTLRLVSEVLSSNGSTSMAATCGSTLSLMDAGIPIKAPVSGIAMGLVLDEESGKYKVLSDILGLEDGAGHMDFKVAGSKSGVTALQMDVKVKGLTVDILREALKQAKIGRLFILDKILETLPSSRQNMSPYAPRIVSFHISPDKIRDVIGPGGKTINGIIAETGVKIDIEDDGMVMITSTNEEGSKKAVEWIKNLTREVKVGEEFQGRITRLMDFGAFAEILPGQEGLIHISELEHYRVERVADIVKIGDMVPVKVVGIDELGRINLSRKALLPNHGGQNPAPRSGHRPSGSRFSGHHR